MFLLAKSGKIQLEPKNVANLRWIEVDDGTVIGMRHIQYFYCDGTTRFPLIRFVLRDQSFCRSFEHQSDRDVFFEALKEKLGVLV